MRLPRRIRSCCSSSAKRDHSRSAITAGSPASMGRNRCGSVRNPPAATRASRRSSLAPARLTRSRRRSSCLGLIACTAKPRSRRASTTGPCGTSIATATRPGSPAADTSQSHRAAKPAPPCRNSRSPTTLPAASRRQTWCFSEPQSTPANQLTVPSLMILTLRDDTSRHDACRSLYGRSKARLPTGPASWPTRWGTCPTMVLTARAYGWLLPTSWPAWPADSSGGYRRTAHRTREQVSDPALKDGMGGEADHIAVVLRLQELIDLGRGKRRIGSEVAPLHRGPVSGDHRLQHVAPALGGVDVAGAQGAAFEITKLIEHEQRMIAGAAEVAVVGGPFLLTKGWADAGAHVEHNPLHRTTSMDAVDPASRQLGERGPVCLLGQHLGLKPTHLAGRCRSLRHGPATHDPAQGRIVRQPVGIIHVFVPSQSPEHGLAKLRDQSVAAILARPGIRKDFSGQACQAEGVIEIPKREQTRAGRDL